MEKSLRNFIVQTDSAFNDSFTTESGLTLYADKRLSAQRLSNRIVKVLELPALMEGCEIKPGYELMIDPTVFFTQNYDGRGDEENSFMVDKQKGIYKVEPGMVVLYRETSDAEWKAFGQNIMVEIQQDITDKMAGELVIGKEIKEKIKVLYVNSSLKEEGIQPGDEIAIQRGFEVSFWIEGKEYFWVDSVHVLAKLN